MYLCACVCKRERYIYRESEWVSESERERERVSKLTSRRECVSSKNGCQIRRHFISACDYLHERVLQTEQPRVSVTDTSAGSGRYNMHHLLSEEFKNYFRSFQILYLFENVRCNTRRHVISLLFSLLFLFFFLFFFFLFLISFSSSFFSCFSAFQRNKCYCGKKKV